MINLDMPLLMLSPNDPWTVRDSFEGCNLFGGTGSGKTTSLKTLVKAMLEAQYGMCLTTVKPDDTLMYQQWAEESGRGDQVVIFRPESPYYYDFLERAARFERGTDSTQVTGLWMTMTEIANNGSIGGKDPYWVLSLRFMLVNCIDLLKCCGEPITAINMYRLVVSAATSEMQFNSSLFRENSYCFKCLSIANDNYDIAESNGDLAMHFEDFGFTIDYWSNGFPTLNEKTRSIIVSLFTSTAAAFIRGNLKKLFVTDDERRPVPPEIARDGAIIILDLPIKEFEITGKIAQSVYKLMFTKTMERMPISKYPRPVAIVSDEAYHFISSYDVDNQATLRSSGTASVYIAQSVSSYQINLGSNSEAKANNFLGNLSTKLFFANSDNATNDYASKLFGEMWSMQATSSSAFDESKEAKMSASIAEQKRAIIEPIEFTNLLRGGAKNDYLTSAIVHQIGRTWSNGQNYLHAYFNQQ